MNSLSWEQVKEFYKDKFGIDGWVVEMYANMDILTLCVSGASNESIERLLEIPREEIISVLSDAFDFEGWDVDMPINPYKMYLSFDGTISSVEHFISFNKDVQLELSKYSIAMNPSKLFYMCETMHDIERKIADEWI